MLSPGQIKPLFVYTMTSGLGDYIIMGDLIRKIESLMPDAECLIVHRNNPHINLWPYNHNFRRFYNIYNAVEVVRLLNRLRTAQKKGRTIFGLQMAPGSIQGFLFYLFLRKLKIVDYIVDFNLINADIITPAKGSYILDIHLNQIQDIFRIKIPRVFYRLQLPLLPSTGPGTASTAGLTAIHPWSRRGRFSSFTWQWEKWAELIQRALEQTGDNIVVFGKDHDFKQFEKFLEKIIRNGSDRLRFEPSNTVADLVDVVTRCSRLISVNTSVVHIAYALDKPLVVLCGPSLDLWIPKSNNIIAVYDEAALFSGNDNHSDDQHARTIRRITTEAVLRAVSALSMPANR